MRRRKELTSGPQWSPLDYVSWAFLTRRVRDSPAKTTMLNEGILAVCGGVELEMWCIRNIVTRRGGEREGHSEVGERHERSTRSRRCGVRQVGASHASLHHLSHPPIDSHCRDVSDTSPASVPVHRYKSAEAWTMDIFRPQFRAKPKSAARALYLDVSPTFSSAKTSCYEPGTITTMIQPRPTWNGRSLVVGLATNSRC